MPQMCIEGSAHLSREGAHPVRRLPLWLPSAPAFHVACAVCSLLINLGVAHLGWIMIQAGEDVWSLAACCAIDYVSLWSQLMQQTYIFCSLWLDILQEFPGRCTYSRKWAAATRNFLFPACVVPINTIVMVFFWSLYLSAPHLIENRGILDRYLETWMNHCLHTNIVIISFLEIIICAPKFPSRKRAFLTVSGMVLAYSMTATGCHLLGGPWAYPIIQIMFSNWIRFIVFQIFCIAIGFAGYLAAEYVNHIFHGKEKEIASSSNGYHPGHIKSHIQ